MLLGPREQDYPCPAHEGRSAVTAQGAARGVRPPAYRCLGGGIVGRLCFGRGGVHLSLRAVVAPCENERRVVWGVLGILRQNCDPEGNHEIHIQQELPPTLAWENDVCVFVLYVHTAWVGYTCTRGIPRVLFLALYSILCTASRSLGMYYVLKRHSPQGH